MIRLHVFPVPPGWPINISPFCLKVETYCRLAGVPYRAVPTLPFQAPRHKLPYIEHEGVRLADSGLILAYLKNRFGDPLDHGLDAKRIALGHLLRRTAEESLYFLLMDARWREPDGWAAMRQALFGALPVGARHTLGFFARWSMLRELYGQGYGRHEEADIRVMAAADLSAIAATMEGHAFALGASPTSIDATLYGLLANILLAPIDTVVKEEANRYPILLDFVRRMQDVVEG
ncbi:MAG TPA: glutathione S-transferase C-terminal domain-containing protein [Stellaceae bacterium]|jgi:glutathione S-transferase|nr:glutathione S-transferase C-terminal domain-containing protein [Stellaceae bacterium]